VSARYLLDTDICIYVLSRRHAGLLRRMDRLKHGEAVISVVCLGELMFGAVKSSTPDGARANLDALTSVASVLPLEQAVADHYADIRSALESKGRPIGGNDLWIAAHARSAGLTLVTNNEREFTRVSGLTVENWAAPR